MTAHTEGEQGKPAALEEGQCFKDGHGEFTIVRVVNENHYWYRRKGSSVDSGGRGLCSPLTSDSFLGWAPGFGPSPSTGTPRPAMDATSSGRPAACIRCGEEKWGKTYYMHDDCWDQDAQESFDWSEEWDQGARDFPRSAPPAPGAGRASKDSGSGEQHRAPSATGAPGAAGVTAKYPAVAGPIPKREVDPYATGAFTFERGEKTLHEHGTPITALVAIQARKKPEPYVCPVDDYDLLPDAGR